VEPARFIGSQHTVVIFADSSDFRLAMFRKFGRLAGVLLIASAFLVMFVYPGIMVPLPLIFVGVFLFTYSDSKPKSAQELQTLKISGYICIVVGVIVAAAGSVLFSLTFSGLWSCFVTKSLPLCADGEWYSNMLGIEATIVLSGISAIGIGLFSVVDSYSRLARLEKSTASLPRM
jgi:hypothetical protein